MAYFKIFKTIAAILILVPSLAQAQMMIRTSCAVPLKEKKSAPSIDLLTAQGAPIDRDQLIDYINSGKDTSVFEPQKSDFYIEQPLAPIGYNINFPTDEDAISKPLNFVSFNEDFEYFKEVKMSQARVADPINKDAVYTMTVSFDSNAAAARSALLRKLGYNIPSPRLYPKLSIKFQDLETREAFLSDVGRIRNVESWVQGGSDEIKKKNLTVTLFNVTLESALISNIPPMHWGIFKSDTLQSRRPFRALLVPLTLLDIDESANMYSFEPAKIENDSLVFSRVYANAFRNETTLGDVKWITKKIAMLSREDWSSIIRAGHYPADIEQLLIEKTIARVNQLLALLQLKRVDLNTGNELPNLVYNRYVSYGNVINGKAYQQRYDGYPHFFAYGDPLNPLRLAEVVRFFSIELISNGIKFALDQANKYLQVLSPDKYIKKHTEDFQNEILNHVQNNPGQPYVQKLNAWGGPIAGGGVSATRSVVAGTYYGSSSPVQMVDSISVNARVGAFIGVSGLKNIGLSATPSVTYNRSYVHVRPIDDIKTALKDNWGHIAVPFSMLKLSNVLLKKAAPTATPAPTDGNNVFDEEFADTPDDTSSDDATTIDNFLAEMKTGEMFMVVDGFSLANNTMVGIPLGAMLGFAAPLVNISENINLNNQYAIMSRTTFYKSEKGLQVYITKSHQRTNDLTADTSFFIKLFSASGSKMKGDAHTSAYIFPSEFDQEDEKKNFIAGVRRLLRRNNADIIEKNFKPFDLDHESDGKRFRFKLGPWQWTKRETMNRLDIMPPVDSEGRYNPEDQKRIVMQGQINKISGTDFYGFFGSILNYFYSFINIGGGARGDDPASNFMGKSKSLIVSTEIETTDSRPNHTLVKLQQTYTGWTMRKKKLLKLLNLIGKKLENFNPNGGLIDEDSFSQTKRVQAYNVIWNLSIYEPGVQKILDVLNTDLYNTHSATQFMANMMGMDEYKKFCKEKGRSVSFINGPLSQEVLEDREYKAFDTSKGQTTIVSCATPWMQSMFDLRDQLRKHTDIFAKDIHDEQVAQNKIHWLNKTLLKLESELDLNLLIKWVGADHAFFQVSVAGYRKGDERAQDEEGRSTYFSNTVGSINTEIKNGPLDDISRESLIMQHEISARYLSDGF